MPNPTSSLESETVDLIASGYEWTCPNCDELNHEIEITESVTCANCHKAYLVSDADHTWE